MKKGYIPESLYQQFTASMPICCVDIVIRHKGKTLLVKRKNYPAKNKWWTPGGKVIKGEKLAEAAIRITKEEVGLTVKILKQIDVHQIFFRKGYFGRPCHIVSIVFLAIPVGKETKVKLDHQSSAYKWASTLPKYYLKYFLAQPKAVKLNP